MKIYLASSFSLKDRVERIANRLKDEGHEITREWWHDNFKQKIDLDDEQWYSHDKIQWVCQKNFHAIEKADAYVLIAPKYKSKKFNGANIEFGYALAKGKECYSIGQIERSGMYQPLKKCFSIDALVQCLKDTNSDDNRKEAERDE